MRHWQHHPISLPSVSRLRLDRNASPAEPASGSGGRFVTPVVLSKVQHYLDTSAPAPAARSASGSNVRAAAAAGMSSTTVRSLRGRPFKLAYPVTAPDEAGLPRHHEAMCQEGVPAVYR